MQASGKKRTNSARSQVSEASIIAFVSSLLFIVVALTTALWVWGGVALLFTGYGIWRWQATPEAGDEGRTTSPKVARENPVAADLTMRIHVTADGLVRATHAMNAVITQQAEATNEQEAILNFTNQRLDEFLNLTERIQQQVHIINGIANEASDISQSGQMAINTSITSMKDIREQVNEIGDTLITLAKLTQRIDTIITSVSEIATQSNSLALNASIESARAGVHGRGFAIVADEVRVLAQQSTAAAAQVRVILTEIQSAMKETARATESGIDNVDLGVKRTHEAYDVMIKLMHSVSAASEGVRDIYEIVQEQAEGMEEIAINMSRIDRIAKQSSMGVRTVDTVATNLTRLAEDLQEVVGQDGYGQDKFVNEYQTERN